MRLDLFLKSSRLIPRRSVAQEFCDRGLIDVNGSPAKSSKEVKAGDKVTLKRRNRATIVEITEIPANKQVSKTAAAELYILVSDETVPDDPLA